MSGRLTIDGDTDPHGTDGLGRRSAVGPGDPGDRQPAGAAAEPADAAHHRLGALATHRTVGPQHLFGHAEQLMLGAVRVDHHAALEVGRRAGDTRDPVPDEAARARLSDGHHQAALSEHAADDTLERLAVTAEVVVAETLDHLGFD